MFTLYTIIDISLNKECLLLVQRESWLIGSLTGAVVFNRVAKYNQIFHNLNKYFIFYS